MYSCSVSSLIMTGRSPQPHSRACASGTARHAATPSPMMNRFMRFQLLRCIGVQCRDHFEIEHDPDIGGIEIECGAKRLLRRYIAARGELRHAEVRPGTRRGGCGYN